MKTGLIHKLVFHTENNSRLKADLQEQRSLNGTILRILSSWKGNLYKVSDGYRDLTMESATRYFPGEILKFSQKGNHENSVLIEARYRRYALAGKIPADFKWDELQKISGLTEELNQLIQKKDEDLSGLKAYLQYIIPYFDWKGEMNTGIWEYDQNKGDMLYSDSEDEMVLGVFIESVRKEKMNLFIWYNKKREHLEKIVINLNDLILYEKMIQNKNELNQNLTKFTSKNFFILIQYQEILHNHESRGIYA